MKKVLVTGANSYIGTSFERYLKDNFPEEFSVDTIDMIDGTWKDKSFAGYDSIFHVAGIAHSDSGKISEEKKQLYYKINTELSTEVAKKAKQEKVNQFIFMSSAIVYGKSAPIGKKKVITKETPVDPENCYGDSKLQAEVLISELNDEHFKVVILRPPMIYGKGCKGNYQMLSKIAKKTPIFPYIENERSMLYIENLCEFVRLMIVNQEQGIFFPQNKEYSNTSNIVKTIADENGKNIVLVKGFKWILKLVGLVFGFVNKAFGNFSYDHKISEYRVDYQIYSIKNSIKRTEE